MLPEQHSDSPFSFSPFRGNNHYRIVDGVEIPFTHEEELAIQKAYWTDEKTVAVWAKPEGGLTVGDHHAVLAALEGSGYYEELGLDPISHLEVGVGAYSYVDATRLPQGSDMYAVDLSDPLLQRLQENHPNRYTACIAGDATALPPELGNSRFKRIISPFLMRYLVREAQLEAILEMVRVTDDGGRIDIIDFNKFGHEQEIGRFSPAAIGNALRHPLVQTRLARLGKSVDFTYREIAPRRGELMLNQATLRVAKLAHQAA